MTPMSQRLSSTLRALPVLAALVLTGCSGGELRVVAIVPETGHLSSYGEDMKRGLELAVARIESDRGLESAHGHRDLERELAARAAAAPLARPCRQPRQQRKQRPESDRFSNA